MSRALVLVLLAACGDNAPGGTLEFSKLTDPQIIDLVDHAVGNEASGRTSYLAGLGLSTACPRVEQDDTSTTFTGGCTSMSYGIIEGTARQRGDLFTFERFKIGTTTYIGTIELGASSTLEVDLDVDHAGLVTSLQLSRGCDADLDCRYTGTLDMRGHGTAHISGRSELAGSNDEIELAGAENLVIYEDPKPYPCSMWRIDGTDRMGTLGCAR